MRLSHPHGYTHSMSRRVALKGMQRTILDHSYQFLLAGVGIALTIVFILATLLQRPEQALAPSKIAEMGVTEAEKNVPRHVPPPAQKPANQRQQPAAVKMATDRFIVPAVNGDKAGVQLKPPGGFLASKARDGGERRARRHAGKAIDQPHELPTRARAAKEDNMSQLMPTGKQRGSSSNPPITVFIATSHFFGNGYAHRIENCPATDGTGRIINCEWHVDASRRAKSDAIWFHGPSISSSSAIVKSSDKQAAIFMSIESAAYYPNIDNPALMSKFDYTMTYKRDATVQCLYSGEWMASLNKKPKPVKEKINAIAYLNSNCAAQSGRTRIMADLMALDGVPVHSFGSCNHNKAWPADVRDDKNELFTRYKFCVAMENSVAHDYVSEKLWQALTAGCIPIYLGPPNIQDFLPVAKDEIIIDYVDMKGPVELHARILELANDDVAYEKMLAWKNVPLEKTLPGFQSLHVQSRLADPQCLMCQILDARSVVAP